MTVPQDNPGMTPINPMDSFHLVAETCRQVEDISQRARAMVQQHFKNPQDLAAIIEQLGTPVYVLPTGLVGSLLLFCLGYEPGFIPSSGSRRFRWLLRGLTALCGAKPDCTFQYGVMAVPPPLFSTGYLAHQLHHWLAYKAGLPGYDPQAVEAYRQFWERHHGSLSPATVEQMSAEKIIALRQAIHRDLDALRFIRQVTEEIFAPANQATDFAQGQASA